MLAPLSATLAGGAGAVQAFVSVTCSGKDVTEVEQLAALKVLQVHTGILVQLLPPHMGTCHPLQSSSAAW